MSAFKEPDALRLLREMRERDAMFKSLAPPRHLSRATSGDCVPVTAPAVPAAKPQPRPQRAKQQPAQVPVQSPLRTAADLGAMIRKARKAMKLNQNEFAAHAGVGRRFVSELESGKGSLEFDKAFACASAAGIDIAARSRTP